MKVALLSRNPLGWVTRSLEKEFKNLGHSTNITPSRALVASLGPIPKIFGNGNYLSSNFDSVLLRVLGKGSLEEVLHIIEICRCLEKFGKVLVNSVEATNNCLNKFSMLNNLLASGIPAPLTHVVWGVLRMGSGCSN